MIADEDEKVEQLPRKMEVNGVLHSMKPTKRENDQIEVVTATRLKEQIPNDGGGDDDQSKLHGRCCRSLVVGSR